MNHKLIFKVSVSLNTFIMIKKITRTAHNTFNFIITNHSTNRTNIKGLLYFTLLTYFTPKKILYNTPGFFVKILIKFF